MRNYPTTQKGTITTIGGLILASWCLGLRWKGSKDGVWSHHKPSLLMCLAVDGVFVAGTSAGLSAGTYVWLSMCFPIWGAFGFPHRKSTVLYKQVFWADPVEAASHFMT